MHPTHIDMQELRKGTALIVQQLVNTLTITLPYSVIVDEYKNRGVVVDKQTLYGFASGRIGYTAAVNLRDFAIATKDILASRVYKVLSSFQSIIKYEVEHNGKTLYKIGQSLRCHPASIYIWAKGKGRPSKKYFPRIMELYSNHPVVLENL